VRLPWDEFARRVAEATGFSIQVAQGASSLEKAELIIVGGGNTFQLLRECRARGMLEVIRERVKNGCRYLGWSEALGLIAFQINPHYVSVSLPGHHGETRDERLEEFAQANPGLPVIGLPEGDWIRVAAAFRRQKVDFRF